MDLGINTILKPATMTSWDDKDFICLLNYLLCKSKQNTGYIHCIEEGFNCWKNKEEGCYDPKRIFLQVTKSIKINNCAKLFLLF